MDLSGLQIKSDPLAQQPFFATALMYSRIHYYRLTKLMINLRADALQPTYTYTCGGQATAIGSGLTSGVSALSISEKET